MGVWESQSIDKNFDEIAKEIEKMRELTTSKFKKLEESTGLAKIQHLTSLKLAEFKVRRSEHRDGWYNDKPILRVEWNSYDIDKLVQQGGLLNGVNYKENWHYTYVFFDENKNDGLEKMIGFINAIADTDKDIHIKNVEKVKSNKETETRVFDLLKQVGIRNSYYGYKTGRSRNTTELYYNFTSEIRKQIPTQYSENRLEELKKSLIDQIKKIWNDELYKMKQERVKKEKEEKEKEYNKMLALLLAKYDLELTDSWSELNEAIIDRNKYLRLAHSLEMNRNDWTEGYSHAECGLNSFTTESDLDRKIYNDISSYMFDKWDGDGRVFRDCEYNYDVIYGIAANEDPQLYKDYQTVQQHLEL
ncbi:hypothetical protein [Paenibacillus xylanexedens]|uniref:hypothetical protein n=1 Tax=Paenibacillus xylanexedens TaxID=528191 RepID=UPI000F53EB06|nr:hypothetical protein [Paenibacillus xylanexedens]RPK31787.1 hypothetical protein EDO6_02414 [Paenibacillus xylanexedens]